LQAISEKIKSLDFSECKVRVLNVDSQSSYDNIVVQVIGELSNKSQPHHKFVQTFILATQPNGYFVLNDIFRYLNDDEDEIIEDEPVQEEVQPVTEAAPEVQPEEPEPEPAAVQETVNTESAIEQVDEKLEEIEEPATAEAEVNGVDEEESTDKEIPEVQEPEQTLEETVTVPETEQPIAPEPTPAQSPPQPASGSEGPAVKKTWASLVGTKAPAIPALPQTTPPPTAPTQPKSRSTQPVQTGQAGQAAKPATEPAADSVTTPTSQSNGWQTADHGKKARNQQPKAQEGVVHAYIKNVNEKIDARLLREVLEQYGKLKYYDVSRPKV